MQILQKLIHIMGPISRLPFGKSLFILFDLNSDPPPRLDLYVVHENWFPLTSEKDEQIYCTIGEKLV